MTISISTFFPALRKTVCLGLLLMVPFLAPSIMAHHSAIPFDFTIRDHQVEGRVVTFQVANPHTHIVLVIDDEKGQREVEFEGHSRNNYFRSGWREGMVNVGDMVTLTIAPMKDGTDGGYVLGVTTADGTSF